MVRTEGLNGRVPLSPDLEEFLQSEALLPLRGAGKSHRQECEEKHVSVLNHGSEHPSAFRVRKPGHS
jgi:hypothetical protein